jgi:alkylhydroperoxidase family enzyme
MLVDLLEEEAVPLETLRGRYGALLELVRTLIGVVPNCDNYLEIWPTAFRTYNVMVPNFLNLPMLAWGMGAPRDMVGLGLYVSSRASGCPYCSAHTCSFALRRGATVEQVQASMEDDARLDPPARAVTRVARALGRERAELSAADRAELERHFTRDDVEWIVMGIAMMGWLNKTMDALGVPLELSTVEEVNGVISRSGWTPDAVMKEAYGTSLPPGADTLATKLGLLRHAPSALSLDRKWTAGVPDSWPRAAVFLKEKVGHDFPVLSHLRHGRAIRAITTMIRDNFTETVVGREQKLLAGLIYAEVVGADHLTHALRAAGARPLLGSPIEALARAIATSPARMDDAVVETCRALAPAAIVEVVTFVALMQLLHRLHGYYEGARAVADAA